MWSHKIHTSHKTKTLERIRKSNSLQIKRGLSTISAITKSLLFKTILIGALTLVQARQHLKIWISHLKFNLITASIINLSPIIIWILFIGLLITTIAFILVWDLRAE